MENDDKLINDLISRINVQIKLQKNINSTGYQTQDQIQQDHIRKLNEETLINLSSNKLNIIASGLSDSLEGLIKRKDKDETNEHNSWAQSYILNLLAKCMAHQWYHIKSQFRNVQGLDEKEAIRLKEKEEQILPPPLEENLAKLILFQAVTCLMRALVSNELDTQVNSGKVIFQLSATNYETVSAKIGEILHVIVNGKGEADEAFTNQFFLIEHLNLNSKRLSELLDKITKSATHFKKERHQFILSQVLRKAVWNWIDNYPMEFVTLCKMCERLPGQPDVLFDVLDGWAKKTAHKNSFWPLQTMLLILCPDIMLAIHKNEKSADTAKKESFLDSLKKSLKVPKLADVAAICYVDICKASTFVSKSEMSALRYIVPGIETELKERLFNVARTPDGPNDIELMTDCLVSFFKISPRKVLTLIPENLADTPPHFKMVLVKSLLRIAQEDSANTLPWSPSIGDAYALVSVQLKQLFNDNLQSIRSYNSLKNASDKKSKAQFEKVQFDTQVMSLLIQLFLADPNLSLYTSKPMAQNLEDIRMIITGLCYCSSQFQLPEISDVAAETLLKFHNPIYIDSWYEKKMINGFWEISSAVNVSLANALIEQKETKAGQVQKLITLLEEILIRRNAFLDKSKDTLRPEASVRDVRLHGSTKLEVALLIHLCSPEPDICSKCATCFGLLCEEIEILGDTSDEANSIVTNYTIYKKLSTAGILQTGRQHQQKVIRSLLRRIEAQTPGNFAAWEEVYQRWQALTPLLVQFEDIEKNKKPNSVVFNNSSSGKTGLSATDQKTAAEIKQEWHNSLGFLCSMSGVTLNKETTVRVTNDKLRVQKKMERTIKVIASFLDEVAEMMVHESAFMRESAVLLVGTGLSPAAYAWLFRVLQDELQSYFGDAGQLLDMSERCTLFVEQTISVVKHVLDISQEAEDLSIITSFENLMLLIIKYINHLVTNTSMRIKKNFCALLDVMMLKRHYISFSKEMEFRNSLLENIVEWTSDFAITPLSNTADVLSRMDSQGSDQSKTDQTKKLIKEVDIACITTIASLLRGLELPTTDAGVNMFKKYFTFFTTLLTRCKQDAAEGSTALADGAIKSLSNMLSANIHYEYFVMMGYHEDHETRAAFLRVIANILNQGTGFDPVADEPEEKYEKFVDMLLEPEFCALLAFIEVIPITDCDELAPILVNFLEHNDRTMMVLKKVIHQEVVNTESANSLLRRNSMATKMLGAFTKHIGRPYLKLALYPVINQLINQKESMEIDPSRLAPNEDAAVNANRLISLTKQFLTAIQESLPHLPIALREISAHISKVVAEAFPGNEKMAIGAIGGIMFLRFICPAILNPDFYGIVSAGVLTAETRRALTLCVKLLQNMANGQLGVRESFMSACNAFVAENMKTMEELLESFAVISPDLPAASKSAVNDQWTWEAREEDTIIMHRHMVHNLEKITNMLSGPPINQKAVADHLTQVLQRLGPPPALERKKNTPGTRSAAIGAGIGAAAKSGNHYEDFMRRHESTNIEHLKQKKIFYKQGVTKDKLPVFYYIARRYEASFDMEQLLYLILKTCKDSMRTPFSMVIDCTLITGEHNIPMSWCSTWMRHFPQQLTDNLKTIYIVSPNHILKKFMKRVSKLIGRAAKKVVFISNPVRLFEHVVEAEHGLPATTLAMETDVKSTFSPVIKFSGQYHEKNITLRVTNDTIQMISLKLYPILGKPTPLIDIYHIVSIHEIDINNVNDDDQEFYIKYESNGPKSMTFRSPQRAQIIQAVVQCIARWKLSKPENKVSNRVFRPQDIPGTLLNVALLNLGSTRNALRVAAYNMLSALCRNSNFSINMQMLETNGLCIPKNISQFIIRISEKLSKTQTPLTLEFLQESLHGFTKASAIAKHLVLDYIEPWIPNLALFSQRPSSEHSERYKKTINVINQLIDLSIKEVSMKSVILAKIWTTFGRQKESLILLVLKCLVRKCQDSGFGHPNSEAICEMVSSMGSVASQLVSGKLISRVIRILERTSEPPHVSELSEHRLWPRLIVYLRLLLHLSFDNSICAHLYLSDILHIICTLFSVGNIYVRISVHALLINTIHSLYTYFVPTCSKLSTVPFLLTEFGQPSLRLLFGINNSNISAADSPPANDNTKDLERMSITNVDPVVNAIFGLLNVFKDNIDQAKVWHSRWLSLTTLAALRPNPPLQSRALITLGIIARQSQQPVKDEMIFDILCVLRVAASSPRALQDYADIIVGALQCLTRLFEYLSPTSVFIPSLFWIATTFVQLYDSRVFPAAIALLETILKTMDRRDLFTDSVSNTMMLAREPHAAIISKLDNITGISFESNFGFAITSHLLKGLKYASTKTATSRLLSTFLNISTKKSSGASILAYLGALLTTEGEVANIDQITLLAGESSRTAPTQLLFNEHMIPDADHAALLFTLLVTILSHSDREHEQLFIYEALKEGIQFMPESFPVMYRTLIPKISTVISSSQIEKMIQACLSIMVHMFSFQMESPTNTNKLSLAHLKKIRFQGMPDCGAGFYRQSTVINESILKACSELLDSMCKQIETENGKDDHHEDDSEEEVHEESIDEDLDDFSDTVE
ncbi:neurofibromin [Heterostelium album PN500]|uniref:Neurofibromin n=1 Tax=Heterostelium pallidum (strain ATCC 26659 / Pp 5 / PN500) TaxID=670386 RepID=D3B986_HETP5|nr:neurofibromin [Heterostelium album PN500]EFA82125.1 neurofibromin [Heterostelium album PN500]|eukprot:XP_020434242.1 neurofibromin [Heterostelium album PN500]